MMRSEHNELLFPFFHSFSIWLLLAIIIQSTQKCVWVHPGIQSSEENTIKVKRKHCGTSAQDLEDTYVYSLFINIINDLSFPFPTISFSLVLYIKIVIQDKGCIFPLFLEE